MSEKSGPDKFLTTTVPRIDDNLAKEYFRLVARISAENQQAHDAGPKLFPASREDEVRAGQPQDDITKWSPPALNARAMELVGKSRALAERVWKQARERDPVLAEVWKEMCTSSFQAVDEFFIGSMMLAAWMTQRALRGIPPGSDPTKQAE